MTSPSNRTKYARIKQRTADLRKLLVANFVAQTLQLDGGFAFVGIRHSSAEHIGVIGEDVDALATTGNRNAKSDVSRVSKLSPNRQARWPTWKSATQQVGEALRPPGVTLTTCAQRAVPTPFLVSPRECISWRHKKKGLLLP